jgi:hypothetical protein
MVTTALTFQCRKGDTFKSRGVQFFETYNAMSWKKFVLLGHVVACVFAASTGTAQMRGHGGSMPRMEMRGAFMPHSMAQMPMQRAPMRSSAFAFHHFNDGDFDRDDRFRRFQRFNDGDFDRDDRSHHFHHFHHFHDFNDSIIFDNFGFPFLPFLPTPPPPFPPF